MVPDYVVIGHLSRDVQADGSIVPGGTVTYAALTARNLGRRVGVVTSASDAVDLAGIFEDIEVACVPAARSTSMENIYVHGTREQRVRSVAAPLAAVHVPPAWFNASVVHLGPLVMEVDPHLASVFPNSLLGVTPQGWMRRWTADGRVHHVPWSSAKEVLAHAAVLVFSEEDVGGNRALLQEYVRLARLAVATDGWRGAVVYQGEDVKRFPAYLVHEVDPTGAGDVFAAAYMIRLEETGDPLDAARFANAVASFTVERRGLLGVPSRLEAESRLRKGRLRVVEPDAQAC